MENGKKRKQNFTSSVFPGSLDIHTMTPVKHFLPSDVLLPVPFISRIHWRPAWLGGIIAIVVCLSQRTQRRAGNEFS